MKSVVKIGIAFLSVIQKIEKARHIALSMTGNTNFPSPSPTIATLVQVTNQLEAAMLKAKNGTPSDTAAMYEKEEIFDLAIKQLGMNIEGVANQNPASAVSAILSSGFELKSKGVRDVPEFSIKLTGNPGEVGLRRKAVKRGTFEFQICTDISNEANWATFEAGTRGNIVKRGLLPNTRYYFRVRVITSAGPSAWSEVRSVFVME